MSLAERLERIERPLRHFFRTTRTVIPAATSSTGFFESAIRCGVERRLLAVVGGEEGERIAAIAEACGKEVVRAVVPPGRTIEPEHLERFLGGPEIDAVSIVHAEASTGALAPLAALARIVRARDDVLVLVDATHSAGADPLEFDLWGLDFACTGSEHALGLPAGFALAVASKRLIARAAALGDRGWHLDLARLDAEVWNRRCEIAEAQLIALAGRLDELDAAGGVEACWARLSPVRSAVDAWARGRDDLALLAVTGRRAGALSVIRLRTATAADMAARVRSARGYVSPGEGALRDSTLRLRHSADLTSSDVAALLAELDDVLRSPVT